MAMSMSRSSKGLRGNCKRVSKQSRLEDNKRRSTTHLLLLELGPVLLVVDHEALGSLWVTHVVGCEDVCVVVWYWVSGQEVCSFQVKDDGWNFWEEDQAALSKTKVKYVCLIAQATAEQQHGRAMVTS
jgi:hypothetical protein